ncbi:MAG: inositol monophosphatase family protein [Candidatus Binatia bacterium]
MAGAGTTTHPALDPLTALAVRAAAAGAAIHRAGLGRVQQVGTKSSPTDMVTEVDGEAERVIVATIAAERPDDAMLCEEEVRRDGTTGVRWIIDPLDGTTNYLYRFPAFAVSIGVEVDGRRAVGVVHDSATGRVYVGVAGGRATCDGSPLHVRDHGELATALLATGFLPYPDDRARQADVLRHVLPRVRDIRRAGSAALDLCAVAAGRLDGYYEYGLGEWDVAAGLVIAEAAGARAVAVPVPGAAGPLIVVASPRLLDPLVDLLRAAGLGA